VYKQSSTGVHEAWMEVLTEDARRHGKLASNTNFVSVPYPTDGVYNALMMQPGRIRLPWDWAKECAKGIVGYRALRAHDPLVKRFFEDVDAALNITGEYHRKWPLHNLRKIVGASSESWLLAAIETDENGTRVANVAASVKDWGHAALPARDHVLDDRSNNPPDAPIARR
jgi:hypothetical protein